MTLAVAARMFGVATRKASNPPALPTSHALGEGELVSAIREYVHRCRRSLNYRTAREAILERMPRAPNDIYGNGPGERNVEHVWPQSKRGPKNDMHNLYASNALSNSMRGSYPFGVVSRVKWEQSGAKLGWDAAGRLVFEPPEYSKGNVARALFYVSICYKMPIPAEEERVLRSWHQADPVDDLERLRDRLVQSVQGNTNPFIQHPAWVRRIDDF